MTKPTPQSLTNEQIKERLSLIVQVRTPTDKFHNEIVEVRDDAVVVRSEGGQQQERVITYDAIRDAESPTRSNNGTITRVLAQILGLPYLASSR